VYQLTTPASSFLEHPELIETKADATASLPVVIGCSIFHFDGFEPMNELRRHE
jgi:hypothetical protein